MRALYSLLLYLLVPAVVARLAWKGLNDPAYRGRWRERFGHAPPGLRPGGLWVHAVSVGEVLAAVPLVERLLALHPELPITVTTMTPTGSARVREQFGDRVGHCYVPYDLPGAVRRFLIALRPRAVIVMETEIWPNLLHQCARRRVPLVLANARLSARSFRGYRRIGRLIRAALGGVSAVAAQAQADAERLVALGAPAARVSVTGSIKFDLEVPDAVPQAAVALRTRCGSRPVWIAGSTHEGEEVRVLEAHARLRQRHPDALLVLVPRHPERFRAVAELAAQRGFRVARRSGGESPAEADVYLGDTMGELLLLYAAADVAFVGGSLVPTGGHNLLEPAALGRPVLTGPHLHNFTLIAELLLEAGAAWQVADAAELADKVALLLDDAGRRAGMGDAGQAVVARNRGALERLERLVIEVVERGQPATATG
ncbi:MAG TPA: lipid IV(A) 3-deoxy-D-manno-octulosonic acid transferase [Gammaproteobacteria bacterium]